MNLFEWAIITGSCLLITLVAQRIQKPTNKEDAE